MSDTANAVLRTLEAYRRGEASLEHLFRTFVSHRGWIASTLQLKEYLGWDQFAAVETFGTDCRFVANALWIFSDRQRVGAVRDKGAALGPCALELDGAELFSRLPRDLEMLVINLGSDDTQAFTVERKYIPMARGWGDAVRFESLLAGAEALSYSQQCDLFRNSPELFAFVDARTQALITLPGSFGMQNPAAIFTAPDTLGLFTSSLTVEQAGSMQLHCLRDGEWFDRIPTQGMDGITVNVAGGGPIFSMRFQTT